MTRSGAGRLHGYLIIDKPAGWTSHDVVSRVRRLTGERRVGHAGTLDPAATGVLPVAVGLATRSLEYLSDSSKTYLAEITFGVTTDSFDGDGRVISVSDAGLLEFENIVRAVERFQGEQMQIPPMFSAVQVGGQRLYDLARQGVTIEREERFVTFNVLEIVAWDPPILTIWVDCSKGTYVRTLAYDIGVLLGCGAYLSDLVRVRSGPFTLEDAWTLDELSKILLVDEWATVAVHPDAGCEALPAWILDEATRLDWAQGKPIGPTTGDGEIRVYGSDGEWLGIGRCDAILGHCQPTKVVHPEVRGV